MGSSSYQALMLAQWYLEDAAVREAAETVMVRDVSEIREHAIAPKERQPCWVGLAGPGS